MCCYGSGTAAFSNGRIVMEASEITAARATRWPLTRVLALVVLLGFLAMTADIRVEHVDVVRKNWRGWIPIAYGLFMIAVGIVTVGWWREVTRRIFFWLSTISFIVGGAGFWFHNHGRLWHTVTETLGAWYEAMKHPHGPPALAPLAFGALGLLGMLATARRFQFAVGDAPSRR